MAASVVLAIGAASPVLAAEDSPRAVQVRPESPLMRLVPAERVEQLSAADYKNLIAEAARKRVLVSDADVQLVRLRAIASRIIPFTAAWNARAQGWSWEVNLLADDQVNANCRPGGKIIFYTGILSKLQLTDDEVAVVMGHEIAHALREHGRKHMAEHGVARVGAGAVSAMLGFKETGQQAVNFGAKLLTLKFNRNDESEADLVGAELAARAGYDPRAGVTLWEKMTAASSGQRSPEFMSTHPIGERRIRQIESVLPNVMPLFEQAEKPGRVYGPPAHKPA